MRIEIVDALVDDIERTRKFRRVMKNNIPVWSEVKDFPAIGIVYESDMIDRANLVNHKTFVLATIPIYIYNKQKGSDVEDNLSELVEVVQKVVETNTFLRNSTIEAMVTDFKRDGGMLMPYSVAQMILKVKYIKSIA